MPSLDAESVDSIVTDPPYGIGFMGKDWDSPGGVGDFPMRRSNPMNTVNTGVSRQGGRQRSTVDFAKRQAREARQFQDWYEEWASAALRVAKPGAHLLAFGGTRTFHRLACAIEDAGWEIRDTIMWVYGSGFPKSHNGPWGGTALKPAWEPIIVARKSLDGTVEQNHTKHGTGALNIDRCRVAHTTVSGGSLALNSHLRPAISGGNGGRIIASEPERRTTVPVKDGRWPANLIHDGSEEVLAAFPETKSGKPAGVKSGGKGNAFGMFAGGIPVTGFGDAGSAARFFYCAKASREDRNSGLDGMPEKPLNWSSGTKNPGSFQAEGTKKAAQNPHPTVKPTALMRYLCRLVTPRGGLVLDPFAGSGSTGRGAVLEGFRFIGIEREAEYVEIARRRIAEAASTLDGALIQT